MQAPDSSNMPCTPATETGPDGAETGAFITTGSFHRRSPQRTEFRPSVVISSPGFDEERGLVSIFLDPPTGTDIDPLLADVLLTIPDAGSRLGPVAVLDVNADGYDDLVVGAPGYQYRGGVFFYLSKSKRLFTGHDGTSTLDVTLTADALALGGSQPIVVSDEDPALCFGSRIGSVPSVDGDSLPDLLVTDLCAGLDEPSSDQQRERQGTVWLFRGDLFRTPL